MTGASFTLVKETLPAKMLLRLLTAEPSLAWIENVGASFAAVMNEADVIGHEIRRREAGCVAPIHAIRRASGTLPWVTLVTEKVKLELSGSVTPTLAGVSCTMPPSDRVREADVMTGASFTLVKETFPQRCC